MDAYAIPEATYNRLEDIVTRIEADPGRSLSPEEFEVDIDTSTVLSTLPPGLSDDDFVGILKLAMLTECATSPSYAYFPTDPTELDAIFSEIATQLSNLRLAQ